MRSKIKILTIMCWGAVAAMLLVSGCAKDDTAVVGTSVTVTKTVSFASDMVPLFTANCALSGCHVKGSAAPDLESATAYSQIISMGLIDKNTPANSIIYQYLMGVKTPAMPLNQKANPGNINGYMLAWIQQGANNN